jgi:hypothetical protein
VILDRRDSEESRHSHDRITLHPIALPVLGIFLFADSSFFLCFSIQMTVSNPTGNPLDPSSPRSGSLPIWEIVMLVPPIRSRIRLTVCR